MVSTSFVTLVFMVCLQTVLLSTVSNCAKTMNMYWNTTNSIFRIDNTDHIIDVNKNNAAFEYDQVNIICPVYQSDTYDEDAEKYIIYNVSKEEYETCRITNPTPRVIAICDKPTRLMYFTITFRPFTPQPGGLEFHPGKDYYFISTSSKEDLHRRIGGRCTTHNMKVVFKVCCNDDINLSTLKNNSSSVTSSSTASSGNVIISSNNHNHGMMINTNTNNVNANPNPNNINNNNGNSISTSASINNSNSNSNNNHHSNNNIGLNGVHGILSSNNHPSIFKGPDRYYPGHNNNNNQKDLIPTQAHNIPSYNTPIYHSNFPQPPPIYQQPPPSPTKISISKKKNKEYSDHPNEVVKNEELTYTGSSSSYYNNNCLLILLCSLLTIILLPVRTATIDSLLLLR